MSQHITMSMQGEASQLSSKPSPEFSPLDFPGWQGLGMTDSGIFMFMFNIAADAEKYPLHASEDEWLALVIEGSGTLYAGTTDSKTVTAEIAYQAGDYITFQAHTPHAWKNDASHSKILFCKTEA